MKKIIAIILVIIGIAGGGAAGLMLKPAPPKPEDGDSGEAEVVENNGSDKKLEAGSEEEEILEPTYYIKIGRQTIVPILDKGETRALMMFELAVDVPPEQSDRALAMEPRLRDAFLRELFQMSYTGAFNETFTDDRVIEELRRNLVRAAREHLGKKAVNDVLILDVMRQNTP